MKHRQSVDAFLVLRVSHAGSFSKASNKESIARYLCLGDTDIWGQMMFCCWGCPVHSLQGVYPHYAEVASFPTHPVVTTMHNVSRHCQLSPGLGFKVRPVQGRAYLGTCSGESYKSQECRLFSLVYHLVARIILSVNKKPFTRPMKNCAEALKQIISMS